MPEFIPRSLVILTAVVALIALFIGVRDYVASRHEARSAISMSAPSVVQPSEASARKKASTAKRRRSQVSAPEANAGVADSAQHAAGAPLIREVLAEAELARNRARSVEVQPPLNQVISSSSSPSCAPLPNSTKPRDVDAIYYQGWAREYGCGLD